MIGHEAEHLGGVVHLSRKSVEITVADMISKVGVRPLAATRSKKFDDRRSGRTASKIAFTLKGIDAVEP
ncbi:MULTISPECIES: hypothetical protein [unclassified Methylobacterium]|uniref:hypothetical protein n=1 Tax=unclassified Methylobacterium TaxID=2615210 RepID=UPI0011CBCFAD|nr:MULTISPECIES: hypothetical protein [unclassified Methylobacterium]TXM98474.1 hypothetical protein FV242_28580 [Methylobacterium sp. WL64]TXN53325.1 hypothetical protein FV241_28575 [Methylobacterium sp. WL2]